MATSQKRFGGSWTEEKLLCVQRYLTKYQDALKFQPFEKYYIDAFAGTGYRNALAAQHSQEDVIPGLEEDASELRTGSAVRALQLELPFDHYYFVEKGTRQCRELERLRTDYAHLAPRISVENADANAFLRGLCRGRWFGQRGVLFLDPFGMQVEWTTIQAIAKTEGIDLWYLFPLGAGVNRLLPKDGNIPPTWRERLNLVFGTDDWERAFYKQKPQLSLFDYDDVTVRDGGFDTIANYINSRLSSVFAKVAANPRPLCNSRGYPMYLLCFAASNPKGADIAVRIASHILNMGGKSWD